MSISQAARRFVRQRAGYACEYCGVTEQDVGGELTIDHQYPRSLGGTDDLPNLIYCCQRCNQYKSDYWPTEPDQHALWNPREEPRERHLLAMADGTLYPITPTGEQTIRQLRLNRQPLIAHRLSRAERGAETRLLTQMLELVSLLEQMQRQHATLLAEQRALLEDQRMLLAVLLEQRS